MDFAVDSMYAKEMPRMEIVKQRRRSQSTILVTQWIIHTISATGPEMKNHSFHNLSSSSHLQQQSKMTLATTKLWDALFYCDPLPKHHFESYR